MTGLHRMLLTTSERRVLGQRLGNHNIFDPLWAVDFYEIDLKNPEDRFIAQELVHLAITEPGENCLDESYENIDFEMPGSWVTEVPRKGIYTCFYCREPATIERCVNTCFEEHPGSVPEGHVQSANGEWVRMQKAKNVKR